MPVYAALRSLGRDGLAELVDRCCELARRLADAMDDARRRCRCSTTSCSTRCSCASTTTTRRRARSIAEVQRGGEAWLGGTVWQGRAAARVSVSNWSTTEAGHRPPGGGARAVGRDSPMAGSDVADTTLAVAGEARIEWADGQMPVLRSIRERFARERPLDGLVVGACLHVTSETAVLVRTLAAGGADVALCASNPFATQDDVAAALAADGGEVHAVRGDDAEAWAARVAAVVARAPRITLDDGADLLTALHLARPDLLEGMLGGTEETTTGLVRLRALQAEGRLACPVFAVNEAVTERVQRPLRHRPVGDRRHPAHHQPAARRPHARGVRLRLDRQGHRAARRRARRVGDRLRGRPAAGARGADGRLRGAAGARCGRARRRVHHRDGRARRAARASTSSG